MRKRLIIPLLALGHGLNDLVAGYFLGRLVELPFDTLQIGLGLILYNVLAFGGQYPVALWIERMGNHRLFLFSAVLLNIIAIALFGISPSLSIILAGIASAIYHVAGGAVCAKNNKAESIGLFAAPGVAGLMAGGYLAWAHISCHIWLLVATILFLLILSRLPFEKTITGAKDDATEKQSHQFDRHDLVMILLLTMISLRSVIWNIFQLVHENNYQWLFAIAVAAFIGKIAGGWLADRIGWRLYLFISLTLATPLVSFFRKEFFLFCIGIGLLQSGIPATTALLIRSVRGKTERGIGLSFGTAIIAGAIVLYTPARNFLESDILLCALSLLILILLFWTRQLRRDGVKSLESTPL